MSQKTTRYSIGTRSLIFLFFAFFTISSSFAQNAIVTENLKTGTPSSVWDIPGATSGDLSIQGFATDISVNVGGTIGFKVDVNTGADKNFTIDIYRLGYYQGNGARLIAPLGNFLGVSQTVAGNACKYDPTTGQTDCGNWSTATSWTVPLTAVSGYYIAKLTRSAAGGGGTSHIAFIVRNDASTSQLFFKASDATWQAYNPYGGNSLYVGAGLPTNHADKVSYNRPFLTRSGGGGGNPQEDWLFNSEYPMIRFLEANGYDISYTTDLDVVRNNLNSVNLILNHKVFLSVGHDEYWSKEERNSVEAAKAAGIHLAFFSGNEVYWKTRWENSIDGNNTPLRSMVCYKEGTNPAAELVCGGKCDPSTEWTGLWRFGCDAPGGNACKPENALSGEISWDGNSGTMEVPDTYKNLRFWRNTPVAALPAGGIADMTPNTLGYEWDWEQFQSTYPAGRVTMSNTSLDGHIHKLSLYKASSGAIVFGAGTVQWAWGLDANHDRGNDAANISMQQATINLLADMSVQPDPTAFLEPGLTRATTTTDVTPPVSIITAPVNGELVPQNNSYTIKGTATDVGGVVAGVDISVDGGLTWQAATGTTSWSFSWTPTVLGNVTIKSRAFDDIGNIEVPGGSEGSANTISVTVVTGTPPSGGPFNIFNPPLQTPSPSDEVPDPNSVTLGVKFRAAFDGVVSAVRFYKPKDDAATTHSVQLWSYPAGVLLGSGTVNGTLPTGWIEVPLTTPVPVSANITFLASYFNTSGFYSNTDNAFLTAVVNGPLSAIATDDPDGGNGVYGYGTSPTFPTNQYNATNYWVDVSYVPNGSGPDVTPPTIISRSPLAGGTNVNVNSFVSVSFSENIDPSTVSTSTLILTDPSSNVVPATVNYTSSARTATLIPTATLAYSTTYTITAKGGTVDPRIKDLAGNALANDPSNTWTFTTAAPPAVPPDDGAGGPLLVISSTLNPFSRYMVEILRAQGYTAFKAIDISELGTVNLNNYDVILLGNMTLNSSEVNTFTAWVTAGGTLIAERPNGLLLPLMGVTTGSTLSDAYLLVNTTAGMPGAGIVNVPIQYHGVADEYSLLAGTNSLATLYSTISTSTVFPAITSHTVGSGTAVAFSYDLAKSVVYTRQGNPALVGQSLDGESGPIRSDNLFFNGWLDFTNVSIPQADEQQHLLTNILLLNNLHKKPLPHLWFLPSQFKAAVVMTGDDHNFNYGSTETRFNEYMGFGNNTAADVANWKAVRGTSYIYNNTPIPTAPVDSVAFFQNNGFEIALHPTTNCTNFTFASLSSDLSSQLSQLKLQYPELDSPKTNRTHCLPWSDWSSQPQIENSLGMRLDVNYYYWPDTWVQNRPGMFTGSGMPMRFSDLDGNIIDTYQAPTQITDESGQDIAFNINTLLSNAINKGYYGAFVMNMHTDFGIHPGSDAITTAAASMGIPVVSAKQMLTWLDSRNNTAFSNMTWDGTRLSFHLSTSAVNLQAMVPFNSGTGTLLQVTEAGSDHPFTLQTIKGISYGFFPATTNDYVAIYTSSPLPILLTSFTVTKQGDDAQLNWSTSMESNNKGFEIQRTVDKTSWTVLGFVAGAGNSETEKDYQYLDKNLPAGTYYYRLRQVDNDGHSTFSNTQQVTFDDGLALDLKQNRPNPFNTNTTIDIVIPRGGQVQLMLYDQMGRPIQQLLNEYKAPGTYSIQVNRNGLSSGNYYYKMNALGQSLVRKMTIL
jgi:large repetitive protein